MTSQLGEAHAIVCDVSSEEQCRELIDAVSERESNLDILVNNAGTTWGAPFDEFPASAWEKVLTVNVTALRHGSLRLPARLRLSRRHVDASTGAYVAVGDHETDPTGPAGCQRGLTLHGEHRLASVSASGELGRPALDERHHSLGSVRGPKQGHHVGGEPRGGRSVSLG